MIRLADDIYVWRVTHRLTQQAAADLANVHLTTWRRWEKGQTRPGEDDYNTLRWLIAQPPPSWRDAAPAPPVRGSLDDPAPMGGEA